MTRSAFGSTTYQRLFLFVCLLIACPLSSAELIQNNPYQKVLSLGTIYEYDQSSINGYTLLRTTSGIYRINSDRSFQRLASSESVQGLYISPDGKNVLIDFATGLDVIVDPTQWNTLADIQDGEYPYDPYSLDSRNILYKNIQGLPAIYNTSDRTNTPMKGITDTEYLFWGNSSKRIHSVTRGIDELPPNPYAHKSSYFLNEWRVEGGELMNSLKLDNVSSFGDDISKAYMRINLIKINPQNNIVVNTLENSRIYWYNSYLFDLITGKQLYFWNAASDYCCSKNTSISPNGQWVAYENWVNVGFIDTVNIDTSRFFSRGPYSYYTDSVFFADSCGVLFRESINPTITKISVYDLLDLRNGSIQNHFSLMNEPVTKADLNENGQMAFLFQSAKSAYTVIDANTGGLLFEEWDFDGYQDFILLPDTYHLLLCTDNKYVFADFAQKKEVRWHEDPDLQNIQFLSRHENSNELVAAGYSIVNDATVALLKTLDFPALTTKAIIQDGSAIITAFNRSEDGRLIVTGYEDGSVKIRNLESEAVEQTVKQSTSKILYVSLLPEDRVIAVDEERNAYLWNLAQGRMERTISGLHLPARVSKHRELLFAGTEVYDLKTGEKVYRFNEESSDLYSIEISPQEESLLTSAASGETYLWNLPLLFDPNNAVKDFELH